MRVSKKILNFVKEHFAKIYRVFGHVAYFAIYWKVQSYVNFAKVRYTPDIYSI